MLLVRLALLVAVLACTTTATVVCQLKRFLPDDALFGTVIEVLCRKNEKAFPCNDMFQCEGNKVTRLRVNQPHGRVVWSALSGVPFSTVVLNGGSVATAATDFQGLPSSVQSVTYQGTSFLKKLDTAAERPVAGPLAFALRGCIGLDGIPWSQIPSSTKAFEFSGAPVPPFEWTTVPKTLSGLSLIGVVSPHQKYDGLTALGALRDLGLPESGLTAIPPLPPYLSSLNLGFNKISNVDWKALPKSLDEVRLTNNKLEGELPHLRSLMPSLKRIGISSNAFTTPEGGLEGSIPERCTHFLVAHNKLDGGLDMTKVPHSMLSFNASFNELSGPLHLDHLPPSLVKLDLQSNRFTGPVDFEHFPESIRTVNVMNNRLTGRPELMKLPMLMRYLMFGGNDWDSLMPPP